jgi:hypothetical protein
MAMAMAMAEKRWGNRGKTVGKPWENHGKTSIKQI